MTREWTPEQRRAIEVDGMTVLVSAAAGSGKTAVLVERIVSRIVRERDPYGVDDVLVVTFTEAAAAQMRQRIGEALEEALGDRPGDAHLARQLALLPRAPISTLHAFCKRVLRRFFSRSGLDPGFVVITEHEALLLAEDVLDDLLERHYAGGSAGFGDLVDRYGGARGDRELRQFILRLFAQARAMPFPRRWLAEAAAAFGDPGDLSRWLGPLREFARSDARAAS
ncbi:MAG: UvrD-helicase domain-containing protein, partial [Candidatus Sericytochromatia bacterium]|nr:UvrD-helicase domain-containing protein [Candidatus Tanganyikabacteria bacterium]